MCTKGYSVTSPTTTGRPTVLTQLSSPHGGVYLLGGPPVPVRWALMLILGPDVGCCLIVCVDSLGPFIYLFCPPRDCCVILTTDSRV